MEAKKEGCKYDIINQTIGNVESARSAFLSNINQLIILADGLLGLKRLPQKI